MSDWQNIETAPKDGTEILLYVPEYDQKVRLGYYADSEHRSHGKITYHSQGWRVDAGFMLGTQEPRPTHWKPIPTGPVEERGPNYSSPPVET